MSVNILWPHRYGLPVNRRRCPSLLLSIMNRTLLEKVGRARKKPPLEKDLKISFDKSSYLEKLPEYTSNGKRVVNNYGLTVNKDLRRKGSNLLAYD